MALFSLPLSSHSFINDSKAFCEPLCHRMGRECERGEREVIAVMPLFDGRIVDGLLHYQLNHLCVQGTLCVYFRLPSHQIIIQVREGENWRCECTVADTDVQEANYTRAKCTERKGLIFRLCGCVSSYSCFSSSTFCYSGLNKKQVDCTCNSEDITERLQTGHLTK